MTSKPRSRAPKLSAADETALREILGYVNFSNGTPDAGFQRNLNSVYGTYWMDRPLEEFRDFLLKHLVGLKKSSPTFAESTQAAAVVRLVIDATLPAYRRHHADLLFHLSDEAFGQPFFLARVFEAVLAQGPGWEETPRIVEGALDQLNDFLGLRPLAVLENERQMEPYPHERFRPVPLYIRDAGVAAGVYHDLIERTIAFFDEAPPELLREAYFELPVMEELAIDLRAHDHTHPANKRTNYMFGEWDPHQIDTKGRYRRFIIRKIILDALLTWMDEQKKRPREEVLYDASAVLCGTMLMASAISGAGPDTHDSSVTLTSLLPKVARQRDAFYARLLEKATGARAKRLAREARLSQQPFGHVRQALNMHLARYGAMQVQYRHLAQLFARMGYPEASREKALAIPSTSTRFECEIQWRITAAHRSLDGGELPPAVAFAEETEDLLHRGIACGAIVDPWNILGFQGQFPLFSSREDSIPDQRIETLLELMEQIFGVYSRCLGEAAAQGDKALAEQLSERFGKLAAFWDQFAASIVEDLPKVSGRESWESAAHVSQALSEWHAAGEAAGDISFWRQHVERFQSAKAYALVVEALLDKQDHVAAMGLMMQWLSQADEVGLESGPHSIHTLLTRWINLVTGAEGAAPAEADSWPSVRKLLDYLEANAGEYWLVPKIDEIAGDVAPSSRGVPPGEDEEFDDAFFDDEDESEDDLFEAAYDEVTFRDSAADGHFGEMLDGGYNPANTEFEILNRHLEPRLKFLNTLAQLWQIAAATFATQPPGGSSAGGEESGDAIDQRREAILRWRGRARELQRDLLASLNSVWDYEIAVAAGDHDSNVEYDIQLQTKFYLLQIIIATHVSCRTAERMLLCCLPPHAVHGELSPDEERLVAVYRGVFRRDAAEVRRLLPELLQYLSGQPLLYVPFDNGGHPEQVLAVRSTQTVIRFLLAQLPQLGLLHETRHLLRTAYRMERASRPEGLAVTEFDKLFRTALRNSLECVVQSSETWKQAEFSDEQLIDLVGEVVERYLDLWLRHSSTMRLSSIEGLRDDEDFEAVKQFITDYGADLFHAKMLTLGNVRAILHSGIEEFLDYLAENQDPLHPIRLLEDLEAGKIDIDEAVDALELIYGTVVEKFDRFLEYNTTTTQSDYGEMFFSLLDFLHVEAEYERDAWNLAPVRIAHEVLSRLGKQEAALIWEKVFQAKTDEMAERHLKELAALEKKYGMRLPSVSDHLHERFVKPLAVNRMVALVAPAAEDARLGRSPSAAFDDLQAEIDDYLESTSGSGIDVPPWLRNLEQELERVEIPKHLPHYNTEPKLKLAPVYLSLQEMRRQLRIWNQPPGKPQQPGGKRPRGEK